MDNIQFARLEVKVFQGLREGAKTLKEIHQQIDIGELQNIMDDTDECIQKQKVCTTSKLICKYVILININVGNLGN